MLVTVLVLESPTGTRIYVVPEDNVQAAGMVDTLKLAAGHYASPSITNPPAIAAAVNTVLELVAGEWSKYKVAPAGYFEDRDDGIVRVVVTGSLE